MAEILVSDQCERRPPLLIGGFFRCREERGPLFLDRFRLFFSPVLSCFGSLLFFSGLQALILYFRRLSPL
jgi:hypothetical protein